LASSVIENDLKIDGNITTTEGSVDVRGNVAGDITATSIAIQPGGAVNGKLSAKKIDIEGQLKGSLKCGELALASTSTVQADVVAEAMTTESGAQVVGNVNVTGKQKN